MTSSLADIMTKEPVSLEIDSSLQTALRLMKTSKMSHLLVTDSENGLLGVISKRDILDHILDVLSRTTGKTYTSLELNAIHVNYVMSANPFYLKANDSCLDAINMMVEKRIKCIPIVDKHIKVKGIITTHDVMKGILTSK